VASVLALELYGFWNWQFIHSNKRFEWRFVRPLEKFGEQRGGAPTVWRTFVAGQFSLVAIPPC
jgi:hypothetical protein